MGVNAAQHFMNQATFHSLFPILVITKIFDYIGTFRLVDEAKMKRRLIQSGAGLYPKGL